MQNVLKRKNMFFDENLCAIYLFGPDSFINIGRTFNSIIISETLKKIGPFGLHYFFK